MIVHGKPYSHRLVITHRCESLCNALGYCDCDAGKVLAGRIDFLRIEYGRAIEALVQQERAA